MDKFNLQEYLAKGIENIVSESIKATIKNPRESAFMLKFALASKKSTKIRAKNEKNGLHVPVFLISSITSSCNLHCAGCYSRCNHATLDETPVRQLSSDEWYKIFSDASKLGISFIILAGGEPMLRRDVITKAGKIKNIIFPIFTNGTIMDEGYFKIFNKNRNLIPVLSIEGGKDETNSRRGKGIYEKLITNMDEFKSQGIINGASITVTTQNFKEVVSEEFIRSLSERGCKLVVFVEYVPMTEDSKSLALGDEERAILKNGIDFLREKHGDMVYVSFPGDEKATGGCVAAGRGFFHINSHGGAEPCPFSPYSDINVRDTSLKDALNSKLFKALSAEGLLLDDHIGGCVLFEKRLQVEGLLKK